MKIVAATLVAGVITAALCGRAAAAFVPLTLEFPATPPSPGDPALGAYFPFIRGVASAARDSALYISVVEGSAGDGVVYAIDRFDNTSAS